jgi:hypothetical protein
LKRYMTFRISALALVVISVAATAQAATVTKFKLRDRSLIANLFYADECNIATTTVRFAESVTQTDGVRVVSPPLTTVEVDYTNGCNPDGEFLTLTGGTNVQNVHFAADFSTATLSAVVPVTDGETSATVTINLVWTANGPLQEAKDKTRTRDGDTITVEKFDFKVRPADISGTAPTTLTTEEGPLTIDLALSTQGGTIGKDMLGDRTVTKK